MFMNVPTHVAAVREAVDIAGGDRKLAEILLREEGRSVAADTRKRAQWRISKWKKIGVPPVEALFLARVSGVPLARLHPKLACAIKTFCRFPPPGSV